MKINIFFFSKWKWKADALIQTLYKRAPGRDKRKEIPLPGALCPTANVPFPPIFSFATSRPSCDSPPFHRVRREETKTLVRRGTTGRKKSSQRYYFIFRPFDPTACTPDAYTPAATLRCRRSSSSIHSSASQPSQPFIGRLGNIYRH